MSDDGTEESGNLPLANGGLDDDSDFDSDDGAENPQAVGGKGKLKDEDDDDEKKRRRKLGYCLLCVLIFLLILILAILLFRQNTGSSARIQIDGTGVPTLNPTYFPTEATDAPTLSPFEENQVTAAPSRSGETEFPTAAPTLFPTPDGTVTPGDGITSRLPCDEIRVQPAVTEGNFGENNFKVYEGPGGVDKCGDTFGGVDPDRPNRNAWSVRYGRRDCPKMNYDEGFAHCDSVGARWCSLQEYLEEVALGTGCGGDRGYVWTNTDCEEDGQSGKFMFDLGLRDERQPFIICESDLDTESVIRCCGDIYDADDL